MATFEQLRIAQQLNNIVGNMVLDIRDGAGEYKLKVAAGTSSIAEVRAMMLGDANNRIALINRVTALATRNLALLTAAAAIYGVTIAELNSLKTTMLSVCNHTLAATLTTDAEINTESDWILANAPSSERIY